MRALLLAAGHGKRLRPITDTVPKCLVPIQGRPLIDYWFDLLFGQGVERVLINTHYMADVVADHVRRSPWSARVDIVHEDVLLGTGGTVLANADYFKESSFLVAHADNLTRFDLAQFWERHRSRPEHVCITMMTFVTDAPQSCGILEVDKEGIVREIHEKSENPPGNLANGAIYLFDQRVVDFLRDLKKNKIDISKEVLPCFVDRMLAYDNNVYLRDIGTPKALERAQQEIRSVAQFAKP